MGPGNTGNAPPPADLDELRRELREAAEPERVPELKRFFTTGPVGTARETSSLACESRR
jgi:hypothetical protein